MSRPRAEKLPIQHVIDDARITIASAVREIDRTIASADAYLEKAAQAREEREDARRNERPLWRSA